MGCKFVLFKCEMDFYSMKLDIEARGFFLPETRCHYTATNTVTGPRFFPIDLMEGFFGGHENIYVLQICPLKWESMGFYCYPTGYRSKRVFLPEVRCH